jgi:hypothetical protein
MAYRIREISGDFENKNDVFNALFENKERLIDIKKSETYKSLEKGYVITLDIETMKSFDREQGYIYPVVSSCNWFDSHKDVHFSGCFNKTVKEQVGKVKYILDHNLSYDSVLAWGKDVEMSVENIKIKELNKNISGDVECLVFKIKEDSFVRKDVLSDIKNRVDDFQNSIRMTYHKVNLGMKSDAKEHKTERDYYEKRIWEIINKDEVEENGYFWGVEELGIYKEASLVVAGGSNSATSIIIPYNNTSTTSVQKMTWIM